MATEKKLLKATGDKLTHPHQTICHARNNLPGRLETEDEKLTDLASSLLRREFPFSSRRRNGAGRPANKRAL